MKITNHLFLLTDGYSSRDKAEDDEATSLSFPVTIADAVTEKKHTHMLSTVTNAYNVLGFLKVNIPAKKIGLGKESVIQSKMVGS
mmetsp:Transcript_46881/g.56370  ORF Transcript_46881/g.56370 Transcript_46881/m.56370 type:complete len:85 (+) Transcript_46881:106-360(+)